MNSQKITPRVGYVPGRIFPVLVVLCIVLCGTAIAFAQDKGKSALQLESVQKLVLQSSAAQQLDKSHVQQARDRYQDARDLLNKGEQAIQNGDEAEAQRHLSAAMRTFLEAVRLAEQNAVTAPKKKTDYDNRLQTVDALLNAHERIAKEKGDTAAAGNLREMVQPQLDRAEDFRKAGKLDEARMELDKAYISSKMAIESMRGGDTLVRTLHFETKEQEYHYELDRNDTHKMLISVLLKEKLENKSIKDMVTPYLDRASKLRADAEKLADDGEYARAVEVLESSTKDLVRAIRGAGIYIPG
jgi:tetratricopeptide (TPR) repeat protein